jgi:hypothetical protein
MKLIEHITGEQIYSDINKTLSDADRETINHHLANCPVCRARYNDIETQHRQISNGLTAAINSPPIPPTLSFAAIAQQIEEGSSGRIRLRISAALPLAASAFGLILAAFGFWQTLGDWTSLDTLPKPDVAFPGLACFLFLFASLNQFDRSFTIRPRLILTIILSAVLWTGTLVVGFLNLIVITDLVIAGLLALGVPMESISVVTILAVILAAMVYIGVVIGSAEYHFKNIGQPGSWKLFTWTIIIQLLIMVLPYFLL